jgi:hypothetical protein
MKMIKTKLATKIKVNQKIALSILLVASITATASFATLVARGFVGFTDRSISLIKRDSVFTLAPPSVAINFNKQTIDEIVYDVPIDTNNKLSYLDEPGNPEIPYYAVNFLVPQGEVIKKVFVNCFSIKICRPFSIAFLANHQH